MEGDKTLFFNPVRHKQFPNKLWHLVNDPQIISICWDSSGEVVRISEEAFKAEMLSPDKRQEEGYFKLTDFKSFIRQLNLYGFRKVLRKHHLSYKQLDTIHHFHNPNFKQANPELLVNLKRLTLDNRAKFAAGQEVPSQTRRYQDLMLFSSQNYTAVDKKEFPTAPFRQYVHGVQQGKTCDTTHTRSQSFVNGEGNPGNEFRQLPAFAPPAHPYSSMQESSQCTRNDKTIKAFIPHHPNYRLTASACKCCCSGGSYSCMASAYYTYCVCQLDCSVAYLLLNGLTLPWQASEAPDLQSDWNRDTVTQSRLDSGLQCPVPVPPANEEKADDKKF